jgi:hypothetical protein
MNTRALRSLTAASLITTAALAAWAAQPGQDQPRREPGQRLPGDRGPRDGQPGERGPGERGQWGGGQNIEGAMKAMNRALRALKDQVADASKREENLKLIGQMQAGCIAAKGGRIEDALKDITDEAERTTKARHFREEMIELARTLLDVEEGLLHEKYNDAQTALAKAVKLQEEGHKEFGVKDE